MANKSDCCGKTLKDVCLVFDNSVGEIQNLEDLPVIADGNPLNDANTALVNELPPIVICKPGQKVKIDASISLLVTQSNVFSENVSNFGVNGLSFNYGFFLVRNDLGLDGQLDEVLVSYANAASILLGGNNFNPDFTFTDCPPAGKFVYSIRVALLFVGANNQGVRSEFTASIPNTNMTGLRIG
ncbi:hypothetical protein [Chengkuizengella sediminis]|uniref:hypothetical protein n=1 Tax=Chengkuizengella sediminis TaxID=1885917 RepID=UPI001389FF18|nr:hypothetical protein [Chengkuizengella sediminis]NDI33851.1 hypothetical protein [Chengkuizengella sediminis]